MNAKKLAQVWLDATHKGKRWHEQDTEEKVESLALIIRLAITSERLTILDFLKNRLNFNLGVVSASSSLPEFDADNMHVMSYAIGTKNESLFILEHLQKMETDEGSESPGVTTPRSSQPTISKRERLQSRRKPVQPSQSEN